MQNKTRLELVDYEAENLARLQKMFSRKWEFIFMQVCFALKFLTLFIHLGINEFICLICVYFGLINHSIIGGSSE